FLRLIRSSAMAARMPRSPTRTADASPCAELIPRTSLDITQCSPCGARGRYGSGSVASRRPAFIRAEARDHAQGPHFALNAATHDGNEWALGMDPPDPEAA